MKLTETCGCGAALTLDRVDPLRLPWTLIREWRAQHAECRMAARAVESGDIDSVDDARLDPVLAQRAQLGYVLDWDPYGPGEVPDHMRLDLLADYFLRVNHLRFVQNRVPEDLRRIAAELRERSWRAEQGLR